MNKELLSERIKLLQNTVNQLDAQINQLYVNRNLMEGARQEAEFWLNEIDKPVCLEEVKQQISDEMTLDKFKEKVLKELGNGY